MLKKQQLLLSTEELNQKLEDMISNHLSVETFSNNDVGYGMNLRYNIAKNFSNQ